MSSYYPFDSEEDLEAYNERKRQEAADHDAGWNAGGEINEDASQAYQYGQAARAEADKEKPWWKLW